MFWQPARFYTLSVGVILLLQGVSTLVFYLSPPLNRAFPLLLEMTRMIPAHSILHICTGLIGLWAYFMAGPRAPFWFALLFGAFYLNLGIVGYVTGYQLCLGLQPFDHPFHIAIGGLGLVAAGTDAALARLWGNDSGAARGS